jgi:hypothetical protein
MRDLAKFKNESSSAGSLNLPDLPFSLSETIKEADV